MSRKGSPGWKPARPVAVFALDFAQGGGTGRHRHPFGQLVHALAGVMRVVTDAGSWVVPPGRAVWVPGELEHEVQMNTSVRMRTVYVTAEALPRAPREPVVVGVSPLLRELIVAALQRPRPYPLGGADERLFRVLLDELRFDDVLPVHVPFPRSRALLEVSRALHADPADPRTLGEWARLHASTPRTFARRFVRETGLTFGAFRSQIRLTRALELLARGEPITEVSLALGYESLSAFIQRFRRHFGTTPGRFGRGTTPEISGRSP